MEPKSQLRSSIGQKGFGLVEVLIAAGLMITIIYAVMEMNVNSMKQSQNVTAKSDFNSFVTELQSLFNSSGACQKALENVTVNSDLSPKTPQEVGLTVGAGGQGKLYKAGEAYGSNLIIEKMQFTGMTQVMAATTKGTSAQYQVPLLVQVKRKGEGLALQPHTFNLILTLDKDRKITSCSGQQTNFWNYADGNPNNIIYMGGNVGIGNAAPASTLDVTGDISSTTYQGTKYFYKSDRRLKENIREIPSVLERVLRLHGVMFRWKNPSASTSRGNQLGLIAQEVERIFPEVVGQDDAAGMKTVAYADLIAPLIEAIKEQQQIIVRQQQEIEGIKKAISAQ